MGNPRGEAKTSVGIRSGGVVTGQSYVDCSGKYEHSIVETDIFHFPHSQWESPRGSVASIMRLLALCSTILFLTIACGEDGGGGDVDASLVDATSAADAMSPDAMPTASCLEASNHSDLPWIQENILTPGCSLFGSCHMGEALQAGGLNLESGMSLASMLNVDSGLFPEWKMVVPGDPQNSYLMVILGAENGPLDPDVNTMPFNNATLCQPKLDALSRWITELPQ